MGTPVVFVSAAAWERYSDDLRGVAPDLEVVVLHPGEEVSVDDIARVEVAFFSGDVWATGMTTSFLKVCIEAPNLRWLHMASAGVDHPVFATIRSRGVRLTTSSGAAAIPIAQTVIMYLLALARDLNGFRRDQDAHRWAPRDNIDLERRTVGVIGMGPIGLEIARLCGELDMRVIGMRRTVAGTEPCETWTFDRLGELLPIVDDLVLVVPLTDDTEGMLGAQQIAALRPGTHVVNVGRGGLVDEPALIAALESGHIGAAALDVFATEPLPEDSALWDMANVIVTPHSSGASAASRHRAALMFIANLGTFLAGDDVLPNEVLG